jgi:hypothetical protein
VKNIKKREVEQLQRITHGGDKLCGKVRETNNDDLNKATLNYRRSTPKRLRGAISQKAFVFYSQLFPQNEGVKCSHIIREAALGFAKEFEGQDFQAPNVWLDSLRREI